MNSQLVEFQTHSLVHNLKTNTWIVNVLVIDKLQNNFLTKTYQIHMKPPRQVITIPKPVVLLFTS